MSDDESVGAGQYTTDDDNKFDKDCRLTFTSSSEQEINNFNQNNNNTKTNQGHADSVDAFLNWVYAICVIQFDLEKGQVLERIYRKIN